jgi:hypothetical protein
VFSSQGSVSRSSGKTAMPCSHFANSSIAEIRCWDSDFSAHLDRSFRACESACM